jgi:hypothetical protein
LSQIAAALKDDGADRIGDMDPFGAKFMTDQIDPPINRASDAEAIVELVEDAIRTDDAGDDYSTAALDALAALDQHSSERIQFMLKLGEAVAKAKARLRRGNFKQWCQDVLKRQPSWISAHRRLFEDRENLQPALLWAAATHHRWANCHSVERLLKTVADYKKRFHGETPSTPKARPKAAVTIAELKQQLADADTDFIALRDPIPPEIEARTMELA